MAYDSDRQRVVMYEAGAVTPHTWEWDGTQWTGTLAAGPGTRTDFVMTYDSTRQRTLLFGGLEPTDTRALVTPRDRTVIRLPDFEQVKSDPVLYAHANRVLHLETNPGNARALVQAHGEGTTARDVWINPPPIPLTTPEMDYVFGLPFARNPHPAYADE